MYSCKGNAKRLALITYSSITQDGKDVFVNRALGLLVDGLSNAFSKIYLVVAKAERHSNAYPEGKSIYTYSIQSPNVVITPIKDVVTAASHHGGPLRGVLSRSRLMIINQSIINMTLDASDYAYIFLPSFTGLFAGIACLLKRIPFFLYFGSDWQETARFRVPISWKGMQLLSAMLALYTHAERVVTRRALFCLAAGKRISDMQSLLNPSTYQTIPMVQFTEATEPEDEILTRSATDCQAVTPGRIGSQKLRILSVGNVREAKGTAFLLRAIPYLLSEGFEVKVMLVGAIDEDYYSRLRKESERKGIADFICYTGYVNDVERLQGYYSEADVFVLPTLGEGFPRVLYEAMIAGVPIIASDIISIRENLQGFNVATLIPPEDPESIAIAIKALVNDRTLQKIRISAGRAFARRRFHMKPAAQVIELLKKHTIPHEQ